MYIVELDGIRIPCRFIYKNTLDFFCRHIVGQTDAPGPYVGLGPEEMQLFYSQYPKEQQNSVAETKLLIPLFSDWLTDYERLLIHGVAFAYKGKAWILTGPSGIGKSTQYMNLKKRYGNQVQVICGDNPILHFQEDGKILICPSPWNGKEGFGSDMRAELGGIILLKQGDWNGFSDLPWPDLVVPLLDQIMTYMKTEEVIHKQVGRVRQIIGSVPVLQYTNTGTMDSSILLLERIGKMLETGKTS